MNNSFQCGDIVENRYNALRGAVVSFISYPPELEIVLENSQVISCHADDWLIVCSVADSLALSRFNGRGPRSGKDAVHS